SRRRRNPRFIVAAVIADHVARRKPGGKNFMSYRLFLITIIAVAFCDSRMALAANDAQMLTIAGQTFRASGFRPGATVVFFAVIVEPAQAQTLVHRWSRIADDSDHDGIVVADYGRPVPTETIGAAIDLQTGEYAIGSPQGAVVEVLGSTHGRFRGHGGIVD